jgi:Trypsin
MLLARGERMSKYLALILLTACAADAELDELDELASPLAGTETTLARYTVDIGDGCSGILLNPRWILTTARCLGVNGTQPRTIHYAPTAGARVALYSGTVETLVHADSMVSSSDPADYAPHDVGLIHLFDRGIDMDGLGILAAPLHLDPRLPGKSQTSDRAVRLAGWGNGGASCTGTSALRITSLFPIDQLVEPYYTAPAVGACSGDRGGPLLVTRGDRDLVVALYTGNPGGASYFPLVISELNLGWIHSKIALSGEWYTAGAPVEMTSNGYNYRYETIVARQPLLIRKLAGAGYGCLGWGSPTNNVSYDVCSKAPTHKWTYTTTGALKTVETAPRCLMAVGSALSVAPCDGSIAQRFYVDREDVDHLRSTIDGRCVHSNAFGAAADLQPCASGNAFSFRFY